MATTARQASSWALAAEVAAALGEDSTVAETHPGGGQYDVLLVLPAPPSMGQRRHESS